MSYTSIIGIPDPDWGGTCGNPIDLPRPTPPEDWSSEVEGYYYVTDGGSDSHTYGRPGAPRETIPRILPAGSVVFVHGTYSKVHAPAYLHPNGTNTAPVWILGYDPENRPTVTGRWDFLALVEGETVYPAKFVIIDNVDFSYAVAAGGTFQIGTGTEHLCFRESSITGPGISDPEDPNYENDSTDYGIQGIGISGGDVDVYRTSNIVISGLNIQRTGNWQFAGGGDPNGHGISAGYVMHDIWVVDTEIGYTSGCAVQFGAGSTDSTLDADGCFRVYVGRVTAHHVAETAIWTKRATDVVFSQNTIHTVRRNNPSSPDSGGLGCQYGAKNFWMIYNTVYNCQQGIGVGGSSVNNGTTINDTDIYMIGNVIYDIHDKGGNFVDHDDPTTDFRGGADGGGTCISIRGQLDCYIINNTFHDYDRGIYCPQGSDNRFIEGNIFSSRDSAVSGVDIYLESDVGSLNTIKDNLFEELSGACWVKNGATTYTTVASINAVGGLKTGNIAATPDYVSAGTGNFRLVEDSAGIDAIATEHPVYDLWETMYPTRPSIRRDRSGGERPWDATLDEPGGNWDIGAYEFGAAIPPPPPPAATFSPARHITPSTPGDP